MEDITTRWIKSLRKPEVADKIGAKCEPKTAAGKSESTLSKVDQKLMKKLLADDVSTFSTTDEDDEDGKKSQPVPWVWSSFDKALMEELLKDDEEIQVDHFDANEADETAVTDTLKCASYHLRSNDRVKTPLLDLNLVSNFDDPEIERYSAVEKGKKRKSKKDRDTKKRMSAKLMSLNKENVNPFVIDLSSDEELPVDQKRRRQKVNRQAFQKNFISNFSSSNFKFTKPNVNVDIPDILLTSDEENTGIQTQDVFKQRVFNFSTKKNAKSTSIADTPVICLTSDDEKTEILSQTDIFKQISDLTSMKNVKPTLIADNPSSFDSEKTDILTQNRAFKSRKLNFDEEKMNFEDENDFTMRESQLFSTINESSLQLTLTSSSKPKFESYLFDENVQIKYLKESSESKLTLTYEKVSVFTSEDELDEQMSTLISSLSQMNTSDSSVSEITNDHDNLSFEFDSDSSKSKASKRKSDFLLSNNCSEFDDAWKNIKLPKIAKQTNDIRTNLRNVMMADIKKQAESIIKYLDNERVSSKD